MHAKPLDNEYTNRETEIYSFTTFRQEVDRKTNRQTKHYDRQTDSHSDRKAERENKIF
jgi:hypothetical protein